MADPPPRRKAATELEHKLSAGQPVDLDDLLAAIDQAMHDELVVVFRSGLSQDERDSLARDVFVELCEKPQKYDVTRATLPAYAKMRVRTLALDYIEDRTKARRQQRLFVERGHLEFAPPAPPGPLESAEAAQAYASAVHRVRLAILQRLTREQQLAAKAFEEFGGDRFASVLAQELGIAPNLVSQWWTRAKKEIREAIGPDLDAFE